MTLDMVAYQFVPRRDRRGHIILRYKQSKKKGINYLLSLAPAKFYNCAEMGIYLTLA